MKKDVAKWQNSSEGSGSIGKIVSEELLVTELVKQLPPTDATGSKIAPGFSEIKERHITSVEITAQIN